MSNHEDGYEDGYEVDYDGPDDSEVVEPYDSYATTDVVDSDGSVYVDPDTRADNDADNDGIPDAELDPDPNPDDDEVVAEARTRIRAAQAATAADQLSAARVLVQQDDVKQAAAEAYDVAVAAAREVVKAADEAAKVVAEETAARYKAEQAAAADEAATQSEAYKARTGYRDYPGDNPANANYPDEHEVTPGVEPFTYADVNNDGVYDNDDRDGGSTPVVTPV